MPFIANLTLRQIQSKESYNLKIDSLILDQCAQALEGDDENVLEVERSIEGDGEGEVEDDGYSVL